MTGPARLTPTGLQPGSAESFSTFVQGVPAAKTPFTGSERVPLIQNGFTVYAPPGSSGLPVSPVQGMMVSITDGLAGHCADGSCTTFGTNVTGGGGALKLNLWYNGTNWTLMGK